MTAADHAAEAGRLIAYHDPDDDHEHEVNVVAIIARVRDHDRALAFHREAIKHDAAPEVKRAAGEKLRDLS